jgi:hypothetical protein
MPPFRLTVTVRGDVGVDGNVRVLYQQGHNWLCCPKPSPDGRQVEFLITEIQRDAAMIENSDISGTEHVFAYTFRGRDVMRSKMSSPDLTRRSTIFAPIPAMPICCALPVSPGMLLYFAGVADCGDAGVVTGIPTNLTGRTA